MPINIDRKCWQFGIGGCGKPELRGPLGESGRKAVGSAGLGEVRQEALNGARAIGPAPSGEQGEGGAGIAAQVAGTSQADHGEKEQGQEQGTQGGRLQAGEAGRSGEDGERGGEGAEQASFMGGGEEQ